MSLSKGEFANVHTLLIGTHTGTHVDAPYHFFEDGITVDELDLNLLTAAPAVVVDLRNKVAHERITWEGDLRRYEERMKEGVVVLLCTGWSKNWCKPNYSDHPFLDPGAAEKIMERGVKAIGIDAMSPDEVTEEGGDCGKVHRTVLGNSGIIIENLNDLGRILESGIEGEGLRVSVLPLRLDKCDGSPVRAVAWAV
ncbi:Cyclase 1 superfamily protein [Abortiporus biennis]